MKNIKRTLWLATIILMLLLNACAGSSGGSTVTPTQDLTSLPPTSATDTTATADTPTAETPTAKATNTTAPTQVVETATPAVSATAGVGPVVTVMCEFCVDNAAYSVLVIPVDTTFKLPADAPPDAALNCFATDAPNGKQVLLCQGLRPVTFNLNVCDAANQCVDFPVVLQDCPLTFPDGSSTPSAGATATSTASAGGATATSTSAGLPTATATATPPAPETPTATP